MDEEEGREEKDRGEEKGLDEEKSRGKEKSPGEDKGRGEEKGREEEEEEGGAEVQEGVDQKLKQRFPSELQDIESLEGEFVRCNIDGKNIFPICEFLRDELHFEHLSLISAVDRKDRFECVYHITSYRNKCVIQINARISKEDPRIASVSGIWYGANFHEREAYDMMGIVFEGHPNLKRVLLPQDFQGFPLRKDFKLEYREGERG